MIEPSGGETVGAVGLAEQALLGALLWEPARVVDIAGWLAADDFALPAGAAIYRTITGLWTSMRGVDPRTVLDYRTVLDSLATGEFHDLPVLRDGSSPLRAAHLHSLMAMTPAADLTRRTEHVLYGRLVFEASIRRQVGQVGARINQWAGVIAAGRVNTTDAVAALQRTIAELTQRMQALAARSSAAAIAGHAGTVPGSEPVPAVGRATTAEAGGDVQAHEQMLIGACLSSTSVRNDALARLIAEDFVCPGAGATWTAIANLAGGGGPIDFVLVAAELERCAASNGPGLAPEPLMWLARDNYSSAAGYRALDAVTRSALLRIATHAGALLDQLGEDRARALASVVAAAREALAAAAAATRRAAGVEPVMSAQAPPAAAAAVAIRALNSQNASPAGRHSGPAAGSRPDAPVVISAVRPPVPGSRRAR